MPQLQPNVTSAPYLKLKSGHRLPLTCCTISEDGLSLFTSSKDGSIIKWDTLTGKRLATCPKLRSQNEKGKGRADEVDGHTDEVLSLAVSTDGKWLVSGGKDRKVVLWDAKTMKWVKSFTGHKDAVTVRRLLSLLPQNTATHCLCFSQSCSAKTLTNFSPHPSTEPSNYLTSRHPSSATSRLSSATKIISSQLMPYDPK